MSFVPSRRVAASRTGKAFMALRLEDVILARKWNFHVMKIEAERGLWISG